MPNPTAIPDANSPSFQEGGAWTNPGAYEAAPIVPQPPQILRIDTPDAVNFRIQPADKSMFHTFQFTAVGQTQKILQYNKNRKVARLWIQAAGPQKGVMAIGSQSAITTIITRQFGTATQAYGQGGDFLNYIFPTHTGALPSFILEHTSATELYAALIYCQTPVVLLRVMDETYDQGTPIGG